MNKKIAVITIAVLAALGAGGYTVMQLTIAQEGAEDDITDTASLLLTTTRTHLSICVDDGTGSGAPDSDVTAVREAVEEAIGTLADVPSEYGRREVTARCPPPSTTLGVPTYKYDIDGPNVSVPSEHALFVYVVPNEIYGATFGSEPYVVANAEDVCRLDVCGSVTRSLFVPKGSEATLIRDSLLSALRLKDPAPEPTSPCEEIPEPLCVPK